VVGHGDWYTGNLRWNGQQLHVAYDWDSIMADTEPIVVGLAAAVFPSTLAGTEATIEETQAFIDAYVTCGAANLVEPRSKNAGRRDCGAAASMPRSSLPLRDRPDRWVKTRPASGSGEPEPCRRSTLAVGPRYVSKQLAAQTLRERPVPGDRTSKAA
jgi:hypothetical protein